MIRPFGYGMYLVMAVIRRGDRRLLRTGVRGTATVVDARPTGVVIQSGEFEWQAPRVYRYRLAVSLPGRAVYETTCYICADRIRKGDTVEVAVSPFNKDRVTIDVGQGT